MWERWFASGGRVGASSRISRLADSLRPIAAPQAAWDLIVAHHLAGDELQGALANVRANLPSIHDSVWVSQIESQLQALAPGGVGLGSTGSGTVSELVVFRSQSSEAPALSAQE